MLSNDSAHFLRMELNWKYIPSKIKPTFYKVFKHKKYRNYVEANGNFDKLLLECAFRTNLDKKKEFNLGTGCDLFRPVLSSNGFCYSFNGQYSSNVWIDSDIHRIFRNLHNDIHTQENFGGAGVAEGMFCSNFSCMFLNPDNFFQFKF